MLEEVTTWARGAHSRLSSPLLNAGLFGRSRATIEMQDDEEPKRKRVQIHNQRQETIVDTGAVENSNTELSTLSTVKQGILLYV